MARYGPQHCRLVCRTNIPIKLFLLFSFNVFIWLFIEPDQQELSIQLPRIVSKDPKVMINVLKRIDFKYLITKPKCEFKIDSSKNETLPYFITLVHSYPWQTDLRNSIRSMWAHFDKTTKTYFLIGIPEMNEYGFQQLIEKENAEHVDIIQGHFTDNFRNQSIKHFMALMWFSKNCANAKYLVKVDADVFVNIPNIYKFLKSNNETSEFLMGDLIWAGHTPRSGIYAVTEEKFAPKFLPLYADKASIIYSSDVAVDLYKKALTSKFFWIEDIYVTGLLRSQLNVRVTQLRPYVLNRSTIDYMKGNTGHMPEPRHFMFSYPSISTEDQRFLWEKTEWDRMGLNLDRNAE